MNDSKEYIDEIRVEDAQNVGLSICRRKLRRAKVAKKVKQRKSKFMGCTCHLKCYNPARLVFTFIWIVFYLLYILLVILSEV